MKSIISSILVLTTLVQSSRLLQQTDTCGSFEEYNDCGSACPPLCGDSSIGPCIAVCQPGCFCIDGYIRDSNGRCISDSECAASITAAVCGSIENCAVFSDSCNTCDCGVDGSATTPRCTEIACQNTVPYFCDTCATGYEKDATTGICVAIPTCERVENCAGYSTGCQNCECAADGTETCTNINFCDPNPLGEDPINCRPCDPLRGPYPCSACADGYYLDSTGECIEIPSCGGIDYCTSYNPDGCNTCSCVGEFPICTLAFCEPPAGFQATCRVCIDGYKPSADGLSCEPDLGCFCPLFFDPVCCDGVTYGNGCQASCAGCGGITTSGRCPDERVKCQKKQDCDSGYRCKKDPICRGNALINCGDVDKVCVNYKINNGCSSDADCDANAGETCLLNNNNGICVNYQSP